MKLNTKDFYSTAEQEMTCWINNNSGSHLRVFYRQIAVQVEENVRPDTVEGLINDYKPTYLHVECHGLFKCPSERIDCSGPTANNGQLECYGDVDKCKNGQFAICLAADDEDAAHYARCEPGAWRFYLKGKGLPTKCAYFNACCSSAFAKSFSESEGVPCVGINQTACTPTAQAVAKQFYHFLTGGHEVATALELAKQFVEELAKDDASINTKTVRAVKMYAA